MLSDDESSPSVEHHTPWRRAQTLEDLCDLTAKWLEGELPYYPGNAVVVGPDPETSGLISDLAAINRAGLMTDFSQPGLDRPGHRQRAALNGLCSEAVANAIESACETTDLVCLRTAVSESLWLNIPITEWNGEVSTWTGRSLPPEDLVIMRAASYSSAAMAAVVSAEDVTVFDAAWGRNDLLWATVRTALENFAARAPI